MARWPCLHRTRSLRHCVVESHEQWRTRASEPLCRRLPPLRTNIRRHAGSRHPISTSIERMRELSADAAPADRRRAVGSRALPSRRRARTRSLAGVSPQPEPLSRCDPRVGSAPDHSTTTTCVRGTRPRRHAGTHFDASRNDGVRRISGARARARSRRPDRRERRQGTPGCPRARRCDLRPRA
jgi:hypothetical protein